MQYKNQSLELVMYMNEFTFISTKISILSIQHFIYHHTCGFLFHILLDPSAYKNCDYLKVDYIYIHVKEAHIVENFFLYGLLSEILIYTSLKICLYIRTRIYKNLNQRSFLWTFNQNIHKLLSVFSMETREKWFIFFTH